MTELDLIKGPKCKICGRQFAWKIYDDKQDIWYYECKCGTIAPEVDLI